MDLPDGSLRNVWTRRIYNRTARINRRITPTDATGLPRGVSRFPLHTKRKHADRCHGLAPWSFTVSATHQTEKLFQMPRACPVEFHGFRYTPNGKTLPDATGLPRGVSRFPLHTKRKNSSRCHGLAPWSFTVSATHQTEKLFQMPRACPVEFHGFRYTPNGKTLPDATGLPRGASRFPLHTKRKNSSRCHGLAPWSFTLFAM